jgi:hypothetical protein
MIVTASAFIPRNQSSMNDSESWNEQVGHDSVYVCDNGQKLITENGKQLTLADLSLDDEFEICVTPNRQKWAVHSLGSFDNIPNLWKSLNNTLLIKENLANNDEHSIFHKVGQNLISGPQNEILEHLEYKGNKITHISEIILHIKMFEKKFTLEDIAEVYLAAALWFVGVVSDYSDKILGVRLIKDYYKNEIISPQLRFWVLADTNNPEDVTMLRNIEKEFTKILIQLNNEYFNKILKVTIEYKQQLPPPPLRRRGRRRSINLENDKFTISI